ncbi:phosphoribosylglycinamide formyltransferase [Bacillus sp. Marseille-P3661]|uniref:phosphoribosylglycinamide formyltransferase n=1 Tax=Bacillus sp. Marseille-P3661 TaxID=1936234 RepID=UPI000C83CF44|nr:phosphoribosylglycinamide formyltransferase [Bacillus sp. Marseille-P3661]
MKKVAVFASGNGSNFQAIIDAIKVDELSCEVAMLICDRPDAKCINRAETADIPTFAFIPKEFERKADYEAEILAKLQPLDVDLIVLAGYMRLIGGTLLSAYEGRIINIHPSLLPAFPGKDAIGQAFQAKVKVTGVTIHYVDEGMDTGPIIAQETVTVDEDETYESLEVKIQKVEHRLYPSTLNKLLAKI